MPNGIDLILADHKRVNDLFDTFDATSAGSVIGQVVDLLKAHDEAEHGALYPLAGKLLGDTDMVARAELAHSAVKKQIDYMMQLEGAPLTEAFQALRTLVQQHVADEESEMLPELAKRATPQQLEGLGARILQSKQRVG